MSERNYGATGANESTGGEVWASIDASLNEDPKFRIGKKGYPESSEYSNISGYLDGVDLRWSDGNAENKIKPGWELLLIMSVKDDARGTASEQTGGVPVAKYNVPMRSTHNTMMPSLLNVLAGIDYLTWDGYLSLSLYRKEGKAARLSVKTRPNQAPKEFSPVRFPFDEATKNNIGVPQPTLVFSADGDPVIGEDGKQMKNWTTPRNFWLAIAKEVYQKINGVPYTGNIGPSAPGGYKTGEPWGINAPTGQSSATTADTPTTTNAAPADNVSNDAKSKFLAGLKKEFGLVADPLLARVQLEALRKKVLKPGTDLAKWGTNEFEVLDLMIGHYRSITGDQEAVWLPAGTISISSPPASGADDLPF